MKDLRKSLASSNSDIIDILYGDIEQPEKKTVWYKGKRVKTPTPGDGKSKSQK